MAAGYDSMGAIAVKQMSKGLTKFGRHFGPDETHARELVDSWGRGFNNSVKTAFGDIDNLLTDPESPPSMIMIGGESRMVPDPAVHMQWADYGVPLPNPRDVSRWTSKYAPIF